MRAIDGDNLRAFKFHPLPYTHITPPDADAESYKRGWNDAIDAIMADAPTIGLPHWIPVTERLPENDDWQIVTICDESADRPYIYSDFGWYLDVAKCWIVDADQRRDIIAWMPLPEPYVDDIPIEYFENGGK